MYEDYIKPQENSSHYGCDYLTVTDLDGRGLRVEADKPFSFNLSEYTQEELGSKAHNYELEKSGRVILCVDYKMGGVGSASCGAPINPKYAVTEKSFRFVFSLELL